jgi:hypothetical protein
MADDERAPYAEDSAAAPDVVPCWLCGTRLSQYQMLPDGGSACDDVRWYCRDTRACTERWTTDPYQRYGAGPAAGSSATSAPSPTGLFTRHPSLPSASPSAWPGQRGR